MRNNKRALSVIQSRKSRRVEWNKQQIIKMTFNQNNVRFIATHTRSQRVQTLFHRSFQNHTLGFLGRYKSAAISQIQHFIKSIHQQTPKHAVNRNLY